jgi:Spy/CpxP family protein refolding chaperone
MNNHRRTIMTTAALAGALMLGSATGMAGAWKGHGSAVDLDTRVARMSQHLQLGDEQQQQLRTILEDQQAEHERLRAQTRQQVDALLTDEQRAVREEAMTARMERRLERMSARLDLDEDQQAQVRALLAERRDDPTLTRDEMRGRLATVLNDEQQQRLSALRGDRRHGMRCDGHR